MRLYAEESLLLSPVLTMQEHPVPPESNSFKLYLEDLSLSTTTTAVSLVLNARAHEDEVCTIRFPSFLLFPDPFSRSQTQKYSHRLRYTQRTL